MNRNIGAAAETIWQWLPIDENPSLSDMIFVLGNSSNRLPGKAGSLYNAGIAPIIAVSGGHGRITKDDNETEASRYTRDLMALGVPSSSIVSEDTATNTGENISFTKKLLVQRGVDLQSATAVTTPLLSRRHKATLEAQWPELDWKVCTPTPKTFDERITGGDFESFFCLIVGEIDRLGKYPSRGFFEASKIPEDVIESKAILVDAGYTTYLCGD